MLGDKGEGDGLGDDEGVADGRADGVGDGLGDDEAVADGRADGVEDPLGVGVLEGAVDGTCATAVPPLPLHPPRSAVKTTAKTMLRKATGCNCICYSVTVGIAARRHETECPISGTFSLIRCTGTLPR
jgi:hypothetical protein